MSEALAGTQSELEQLLGFIDLYIAIAEPEPIPSEVHPRFVAQQILRQRGLPSALRGARQAVNDLLSQSSDLPPDDVSALDAALRDEGLPTLSELRRHYSSASRRILRRKRITTDVEYYMVKNLVDDLASGVGNNDREQLIAMMEAYEG